MPYVSRSRRLSAFFARHINVVLTLIIVALTGCGVETARVEFSFEVPTQEGNPFARHIWGTVEKPSGSEMRVPAFWVDSTRFAIRVHANESGRYRLSSVEEETGDSLRVHVLAAVDPVSMRVRSTPDMPFVRIDPTRPYDFTLHDGSRFVPIGGNIPWLPRPGHRPEERIVSHYDTRFGQFREAGLNWARVWMPHFSRMNLDWLPDGSPDQPLPGWIEREVADYWDGIFEGAESNRVYVQLVLQHHGQYSTETNPNWSVNPWNAANPNGFLETPGDFFTSEKARQLTKQKYRYIVARWGYSPAVMAWEFFNEVHWVDAMRYDDNEAGVADWHSQMADYIRAIDAHRHLVTTSTREITSPIYERMDYLQPHIYGVNMIDNMRYVDPAYFKIGKPLFYGEFGDDHMPLTAAEKRTGVSIIPPIWAGIMGLLHLPPQTWFIQRLIETDGLSKLQTVARFLKITGIAERDELVPFSPAIESDDTQALSVPPGFVWMNRPDPVVEVPVDGSTPISNALVPGVLPADSLSGARGFPNHVTFKVDLPRPDTVTARLSLWDKSSGRPEWYRASARRLRLFEKGLRGTTVQATVDSRVVASYTWPDDTDSTDAEQAASLAFEVPAGQHDIVVANTGGPAWCHFDGLETGFHVPRIAAVGKRNDTFVALWIWNREGVFSVEPVEAAKGTLVIDHVSAGRWSVEWWDTEGGVTSAGDPIEHKGGTLKLETPEIDRHAAVVLKHADTAT